MHDPAINNTFLFNLGNPSHKISALVAKTLTLTTTLSPPNILPFSLPHPIRIQTRTKKDQTICFEMENVNKNKPPKTRLQKCAPASLQLTTHQNDDNTNVDAKARCFSDACSVIPLLSPLVCSPPSLPESNQQQKCGDDKTGHVSVAWQHPAVNALTEPSSTLFASIFQSQCTLVPQPMQSEAAS